MTVQELIERAGTNDTTLAIAWIKDAIHLIQSNYDDNVATWKTNISDGTREFLFLLKTLQIASIKRLKGLLMNQLLLKILTQNNEL